MWIYVPSNTIPHKQAGVFIAKKTEVTSSFDSDMQNICAGCLSYMGIITVCYLAHDWQLVLQRTVNNIKENSYRIHMLQFSFSIVTVCCLAQETQRMHNWFYREH